MDDSKRLEFLRGLEKLKAQGIKAEDYTSPLDNDVMKVKNLGVEIPEQVTNIKNMTDHIDTNSEIGRMKGGTEHFNTKAKMPSLSGDEFTAKIKAIQAAKAAAKEAAQEAGGGVKALAKTGGRKMLGALPFLGAGYAMMQGDPAMAAEELAEDALGPAALALKSDSAGMSSLDERQMLAEIEAQKKYDKSPAKLDKLKAMLAKKGK